MLYFFQDDADSFDGGMDENDSEDGTEETTTGGDSWGATDDTDGDDEVGEM